MGWHYCVGGKLSVERYRLSRHLMSSKARWDNMRENERVWIGVVVGVCLLGVAFPV